MSEKVELKGFIGRNPVIRKSIRPNVNFLFGTKKEGNDKPTWHEVYCYIDIEEHYRDLKIGTRDVTIIGTYTEEWVGKRLIKKIIVEKNEIDTIRYRRDIPNLRNNYDN